MATTPVDPVNLKATPREMAPSSQAWFRWHPGYQTKLDSRDPIGAKAGYIDNSNDPIGHRTWLQAFELSVLDAP